MIQAVRSFFARSETSIAVTVGVVGGLVLYYAFIALADGFVYPLISQRKSPLQFTLVEVTFNYQQLVVDVIALLLLAAVGYVLFVWGRDEVGGPVPNTRECPECKSEIRIDARRCAFCTSVVPTLSDMATEPQEG